MTGISVVIPCYNRGAYLRSAIDSVIEQRYAGPLEILVADDGSTDNSVLIAESYGPRVRLLRRPAGASRGVSSARNRCLEMATQPLVAFLDADDVWLPGHLDALAGALNSHPAAGMAYDNGRYMTEDGTPYGERIAPSNTSAASLLLDCFLAVDGVMARRQALDEVGLFDETLLYGEDHDLWLRILERFPAVHVPMFGYMYRKHQHQLSKDAVMWQYAARVLDKARCRYPYANGVVRKRQAVISYRLGQVALRHGRVAVGLVRLGKAAFYDPGRAVREMGKWIT